MIDEPDNPEVFVLEADVLYLICESRDSELMREFYEHYLALVDSEYEVPQYYQQFIAHLLVKAARNPKEAQSALGLAKDTYTKSRDRIIAVAVHKARLEEELRRGANDLHGCIDFAIDEITERGKGAYSRSKVKRAYNDNRVYAERMVAYHANMDDATRNAAADISMSPRLILFLTELHEGPVTLQDL